MAQNQSASSILTWLTESHSPECCACALLQKSGHFQELSSQIGLCLSPSSASRVQLSSWAFFCLEFLTFFFPLQSTNPFFPPTCWVPAPHSLQISSPGFWNGGWRRTGAKPLPCIKKLVWRILYSSMFLLLFCSASHFWLFRQYWYEQTVKVIYSRVLEARAKTAAISAFFIVSWIGFFHFVS